MAGPDQATHLRGESRFVRTGTADYQAVEQAPARRDRHCGHLSPDACVFSPMNYTQEAC